LHAVQSNRNLTVFLTVSLGGMRGGSLDTVSNVDGIGEGWNRRLFPSGWRGRRKLRRCSGARSGLQLASSRNCCAMGTSLGGRVAPDAGFEPSSHGAEIGPWGDVRQRRLDREQSPLFRARHPSLVRIWSCQSTDEFSNDDETQTCHCAILRGCLDHHRSTDEGILQANINAWRGSVTFLWKPPGFPHLQPRRLPQPWGWNVRFDAQHHFHIRCSGNSGRPARISFAVV